LGKRTHLFVLILIVFLLNGCIKPKINIFPDKHEPFHEFTLQGEGKDKVLLIPVKGFISDSEGKEFFVYRKPSMVQEVVAQLKKAEKDKHIKAILLKVDSPGGSITASDLLYHEITDYKKRTGVKMVVSMMGVAASGGYYISLPADVIMAHPTTVTGSVGVIFIRPKVVGLMGKLGIDVEVDKSGKNKDMGSPFRRTTEEEQKILQGMIDNLASRFISLVVTHRKLDPSALEDIASARVFLGEEAHHNGLIDKIGYLEDAMAECKKLAGLPENAKMIVYRRTENPNDNIYNNSMSGQLNGGPNVMSSAVTDLLPLLRTGFYFLWLPATGAE
jgi:protease-4